MDLTIIEAVLSWAGSHPAFETPEGRIPLALETLPTDGTDAAMLSTLPGDPYMRRYKDGGYLAAYAFQIVLRSFANDTESRIDAVAALSDIGRSIDDRSTWPVAPEGYDIVALAMRTTPAPIARDDSGMCDYQVTFELTYRKRG